MKQFVKPEFEILNISNDKKNGKFLIEPIEKGFAITIGNAIRRTLLSSTPSPSVFGIRVAGVAHEFDAVNHVRENVANIILNVKQLILKADQNFFSLNEVLEIKLEGKNKSILTAANITLPTGLIVLNPELVIAHLNNGGHLDMIMYVKISSGYASFKDNKSECKKISSDVISIDSNFTPIEKVTFNFDDTKVGKANNLEKLILDVSTNGAIDSVQAVSIACKILIEHLSLFSNLEYPLKNDEIFKNDIDSQPQELNKTIEELGLSQRSKNCLLRNDIKNINDLINHSELEIQALKSLGRKSFDEIKNKIHELNLNFKS